MVALLQDRTGYQCTLNSKTVSTGVTVTYIRSVMKSIDMKQILRLITFFYRIDVPQQHATFISYTKQSSKRYANAYSHVSHYIRNLQAVYKYISLCGQHTHTFGSSSVECCNHRPPQYNSGHFCCGTTEEKKISMKIHFQFINTPYMKKMWKQHSKMLVQSIKLRTFHEIKLTYIYICIYSFFIIVHCWFHYIIQQFSLKYVVF